VYSNKTTEIAKAMKNNQEELEILCIAHLLNNTKAFDKLLSRNVSKEHFIFIPEGYEKSYTRALFNMALKYWKDSGGSLFSQFVLESHLKEKNAKSKDSAQLVLLMQSALDLEVDFNDLHEVLTQLKNRHCLRLMTEMFNQGHDTLSNQGLVESIKTIQNFVDEIQEEMNEIGGDKQSIDISDSSEYFINEYRKRIESPELFRGIPCGLSDIDSKTFGFMPGQIVVFLAPSSGGKSVMMLNTAMHANQVSGKKVLYMSFEMNSWLCLLRHLSLLYNIPYSQIKGNNLLPEEIEKIKDGLTRLKDGPYFEYDVNMEDPTPEYIDSRIRDLIATKGKPDLLVVDYIGNMTVRNAPNNAKDWELQSLAVKQLFIMAKRYQIPVVTAQQINRDAIRDSRKSKEANKFMSYDQAVASGGQALMHLCTYAIAMEPNREQGYCIFHPVKMRDAWFHPFPVRLEADYNRVRELSESEKETIMASHAMASGSTKSTKTDDKSNFIPDVLDDNSDISFSNEEVVSVDDVLDLSDWDL
jgi:replicative DNA helicase